MNKKTKKLIVLNVQVRKMPAISTAGMRMTTHYMFHTIMNSNRKNQSQGTKL